jgi:hypothetical protein
MCMCTAFCHCAAQRAAAHFPLFKQICMTMAGAVVQVHAAAAILHSQRSSSELEELLVAARAVTLQNALAEQCASDAEVAICRSIADMCASCATPVDTTVRPVPPSAMCGLQACCRSIHVKHRALQF